MKANTTGEINHVPEVFLLFLANDVIIIMKFQLKCHLLFFFFHFCKVGNIDPH